MSSNLHCIVQKYLCKKCGKSFYSGDQKNNIYMKLWIKFIVIKLIIILRFDVGCSVRGISTINKNVFNINSSIGYIDKICAQVSKNAEKKMKHINQCNQNIAEVMMFDETFPKTKEDGATNMGVVVDEHGLIRELGIVENKKADVELILKNVLSGKYQPKYFITDYDTTYPVVIKKLLPEIVIGKDFVHTIRQILKDCRTAINKVTVSKNTLKHFTKVKQKQLLDLKKKLLRKQLYSIIRILIKGFNKKYVSVGTIYIEGGLCDLNGLSEVFPSLKNLNKKINKFIQKYLECWNTQMELYEKNGIPLTSNIIESKNSIFKTFSKKAKSYSKKKMKSFFCTIALYQNFDIKTRGGNKGSSAMMRAGIDFKEFGADNFFDAIGLTEIVFGKENFIEIQNSLSLSTKKIA